MKRLPIARMVNEQTGETGLLYAEPASSRFVFMLHVAVDDGPPHELGYWHDYEWQRDGWRYAPGEP